MSFYAPNPSEMLRLGDIVQGFISVAPGFTSPDKELKKRFSVHVEHPAYAVILTPCCSIEMGEVVVAPLRYIRPAFFDYPHLIGDLTKVNKQMKKELTFSSQRWAAMSLEEKAQSDLNALVYTFGDVFLFEQHDLLPVYDLDTPGGKRTGVRNYMISFKDITKIVCAAIRRNSHSFASSKVLELSVTTREDLRNKLAFYYGRPAAEDELLLNPS